MAQERIVFHLYFFFFTERQEERTVRQLCEQIRTTFFPLNCLVSGQFCLSQTILSFVSAVRQICVLFFFFVLDVQQIHFSYTFSTEHSIPRLNL